MGWTGDTAFNRQLLCFVGLSAGLQVATKDTEGRIYGPRVAQCSTHGGAAQSLCDPWTVQGNGVLGKLPAETPPNRTECDSAAVPACRLCCPGLRPQQGWFQCCHVVVSVWPVCRAVGDRVQSLCLTCTIVSLVRVVSGPAQLQAQACPASHTAGAIGTASWKMCVYKVPFQLVLLCVEASRLGRTGCDVHTCSKNRLWPLPGHKRVLRLGYTAFRVDSCLRIADIQGSDGQRLHETLRHQQSCNLIAIGLVSAAQPFQRPHSA